MSDAIIKLARYFETKLAQLQADSDAELARYILNLYPALGLTERTNSLSYMDEEAFKEDKLNLVIYQTGHRDPSWIQQSTNYILRYVNQVAYDLQKDIKIHYIPMLQPPNLPTHWKSLEQISSKPTVKLRPELEDLPEDEVEARVRAELGITQ